MPSWDLIAQENLKAAQKLGDSGYARSCVSRAYYAAFSAMSFVLRVHGPFAKGRETPPHQDLPSLIQRHLATRFDRRQVRELKATLVRLYGERLTADYRSGGTIDKHSAVRSRQDAYSICRLMGVIDASSH